MAGPFLVRENGQVACWPERAVDRQGRAAAQGWQGGARGAGDRAALHRRRRRAGCEVCSGFVGAGDRRGHGTMPSRVHRAPAGARPPCALAGIVPCVVKTGAGGCWGSQYSTHHAHPRGSRQAVVRARAPEAGGRLYLRGRAYGARLALLSSPRVGALGWRELCGRATGARLALVRGAHPRGRSSCAPPPRRRARARYTRVSSGAGTYAGHAHAGRGPYRSLYAGDRRGAGGVSRGGEAPVRPPSL